MSDQSILLLSDEQFLGHGYVVNGYARVLAELGISARHRAINPVADLSSVLADTAPGTTVVQCFIPPLLAPAEGFKNIALVFHEWSRMPTAWVEALQNFDSIWVSSRYNMDVLRASGFAGEIDYIPAMINCQQYPEKKEYQESRPYRFLSVGEWHFRKGFHLLSNAFDIAFPGDENVELHIKTSPSADYNFNDSRKRILNQRLSDESIKALYSQYDAYVTTSLGEGLGLPVAEAMASGLPVLAVNWSGLKEFCGEDCTVELDFQVSPQPFCSRPDYYAPGQECAVVSIESCARALREMVEMAAGKARQMASVARHRLLQQNSQKTVGDALNSALKKIRSRTES